MGTSTWRLRVRLADSPGVLARLTVRLADQYCNVLALTVLPVPDGVVDELVVTAPDRLRPADLVALLEAEGGREVSIAAASMHDLVDERAAALRAVGRALAEPSELAASLRSVLGADSVTPVTPGPQMTGWGVSALDGHQFVVNLPGGSTLLVRRAWAPFTDTELARAFALLEVLGSAGREVSEPQAVLTTDGAGLVLRVGRPADADDVAALHKRCSMRTLFTRYHAGVRTVPRRWLHRLLSPPRGITVLAMAGSEVVAVGQLIGMSTPGLAEVSLLVEDDWQRRGVGTALLSHLASVARGAGYEELVGWCLPAEDALTRTAARAGLSTRQRVEDGLLRVAVSAIRTGSVARVSASTNDFKR
ncbi:GNAT family N-acetyltransferase [Kutzneria sp. CA-103260]|uniref:GNAT family N-acetyltransferase n=1 Tax=Kutzneria sp. CA-103260 TaxID=2802641 RepID=UPI001BA462C4|nr:GNAT family N-acetyltransferase [Kutzneria sp. CA-103260]QUQ71832.1 GNAT family N-acetyltransferase [Kutzneria sp. CA-103260]